MNAGSPLSRCLTGTTDARSLSTYHSTSASVPIVLSKLKELGKLKKGDRIALLGIGSGLNCTMAEVEW